MSSATRSILTSAEYLAIERAAATRSEFYDGRMFAMSGASFRHNQLIASLLTALGIQLGDGPCQPVAVDQRIAVGAGDYCYPDLVVVCGPPEFVDEELNTLVNPRVLIEVLSPSTETWDRGGKFSRYGQVESLTDYVLVAQDQMRVEHFTRRDRAWDLVELTDPAAVLRIESIDFALPLAKVYRPVSFPEPPGTPIR